MVIKCSMIFSTSDELGAFLCIEKERNDLDYGISNDFSSYNFTNPGVLGVLGTLAKIYPLTPGYIKLNISKSC